jgi:hypothetical protein
VTVWFSLRWHYRCGYPCNATTLAPPGHRICALLLLLLLLLLLVMLLVMLLVILLLPSIIRAWLRASTKSTRC